MSLRDQLASKKPNTSSCTFPVGQSGRAAAEAYEKAQSHLELIKLMNARRKPGEAKVDTKTAEAEVRKARQRYEKTSVTLRFRGLTPTERDALASEHTPSGDEPVNMRAYTSALLQLAALDSDLTATEWDRELYESGRWSAGEVETIRETARAAYQEVHAPGIPKD